MKYVTENNKQYEVVDSKAYVDYLKGHNAVQLDAEKSGCLIVRPAIPGERIAVYTENGIEGYETGQAGKYVVQAVDLNRRPVLNSAGQINVWQQDIENLQKKYDMENIAPDGFVKPKGGIQHFVQTDRDVAIMVPWGENGSLIPNFIDKGGYLNATNRDDIYGIGQAEFQKMYTVKKIKLTEKDKEEFSNFSGFKRAVAHERASLSHRRETRNAKEQSQISI